VTRALVVDDDESIVELLSEVCRSLGTEVITASDGAEALEQLRQVGADIVLLDLDMPRMDGFSLLERLRQESLLPQPSVVVVTAAADAAGKLRCAELGAIDHVDKPFRVADLRRRIGRVLAVTDLEKRLREAEAAFVELRSTDKDTGVGSFAQLSVVLDGEFRWAKARGASLSCLVVSDERYESSGGEKGRDEERHRLAAVSQILARAVDSSGRLFRVDAAELVVLLPGTNESRAREHVERIVAALESAETVSVAEFAIACASYPHPEIEQPGHLYRAVNSALAHARIGTGERVRYFGGFRGDVAFPAPSSAE
jgi:PleD family two-component response regulator